MGMSIGARTDDYQGNINVIPLVDIMLVLLIIFIITLPAITHAVKIDLPRVDPAAALEPPAQPVTIEVQFDGTVLWDGVAVDARTLRSYVAAAAARVPQPEVRIAVDGRAQYDAASSVLFAVQRGGMERVGFVTAARVGL